MYKIINKTIYLNRGDACVFTIASKSVNFSAGDIIRFYIIEKGNYENVIFTKSVTIAQDTNTVDLPLTSEETKIGEPLKDGKREYYYEIELNGSYTLVGHDNNGPKLLVLYPEAIAEGGSI